MAESKAKGVKAAKNQKPAAEKAAPAAKAAEAKAKPEAKAAEAKPGQAMAEKQAPSASEKSEAKQAKAKSENRRVLAFKKFAEKNLYPLTAVLCIAIIAASAYYAFQPQTASVGDFWEANGTTSQPEGLARLIVITSSQCPECENYSRNSIENLFRENHINYAKRPVEQGTSDGQRLIEALGIEKLPAYVIDETSLEAGMTVETSNGEQAPLKDVLDYYVSLGQGSKQEDYYVFNNNLALDKIIRPQLWLRDKCGYENELWFQYFVDPYDPNFIKRSADVEAFRGILSSQPGKEAKIEYIILPTYSQQVMVPLYMDGNQASLEEAQDAVYLAAAYIACASEQGNEKYQAMERAIYYTYCGISEDANESGYRAGLEACSQSSHYNIPLSEAELEAAEDKAGLDPSISFNACVYETKQTGIGQMEGLAAGLGVTRTPTFFVDCIYQVPFDGTWETKAVCLSQPDYAFCSG